MEIHTQTHTYILYVCVCLPIHVDDSVMCWGMDFSVCHSKIQFSRRAVGKTLLKTEKIYYRLHEIFPYTNITSESI